MDFAMLEKILDNINEGIYVVDGAGNFVFCNRACVRILCMPRHQILSQNVYRMLEEGLMQISISDIVYRTKQRVTAFQDVTLLGRKKFRQLITSTPVFDENGEITHVIAVLKPLHQINAEYEEAALSELRQRFSISENVEQQPPELVATSKEMQRILQLSNIVAGTDSAVLIDGESGVGKEVIARYIHEKSTRHKKQMVEINCASLPESLLEAELFGYEKGAFTGAAVTGKKGIIEEADGGTLFLDEINSMPLSLQGKLLRVLESKKVQRLGSTKEKYVDFRLVTATNEALELCVNRGTFRLDLYYRLNVIPLTVPPLRHRTEDIAPLATFFLKQFCEKYNRVKTLSQTVYSALESYTWPGNVRELKNLIERMVVMSAQEEIEITDFSPQVLTREPVEPDRKQPVITPALPQLQKETEEEMPLKEYLAQCEKAYIQSALQKHGSTYKAAKALQVSQSTIARRKEQYQIEY